MGTKKLRFCSPIAFLGIFHHKWAVFCHAGHLSAGIRAVTGVGVRVVVGDSV